MKRRRIYRFGHACKGRIKERDFQCMGVCWESFFVEVLNFEGDIFRIIVPVNDEYSFDYEIGNETSGKTSAKTSAKTSGKTSGKTSANRRKHSCSDKRLSGFFYVISSEYILFTIFLRKRKI